MNIGELKHRIIFEQNQKVSDGQGGFDSNWVELDKLWAKAVEQSPRERFYRGEDQHTQSFTFTIRQNQAIVIPATRNSADLRIVHRSQYFRITGISQDKYDLDFYNISAELWGGVAQ